MSEKQTKKTSWVLLVLMIVFLGAAVYIVKMILSDDMPRKKSSVTMVTLLKPPPPPQIKEKPPEPEPVREIKKEEVFTPEPLDAANQDNRPDADQDNTPAGDSLGVDAEGKAGSDAFGLVGKKGGRSLLAGGGGGGLGKLSLQARFAGYTNVAKAEIRKKIMKRLDEEGGVKGKLQTVIRVIVDNNGVVVEYKIIGSSGNHKMDEAVMQALSSMKISEPPPDDMPRTMVFKITSQG
jgi:TonB family protein